MKILFICGSLEIGKDGVGDYTRRLAGELIRQGHQATIIAYNDRHISIVINNEQQDGDTAIKTLCLPAVLPTKEKVHLAWKYLEQFQPDWISLQFVPYAFHDKGLPIFLAQQLQSIGQNYKWQIMFHELWIGENESGTDPLKLRLIGTIQKGIVIRLIKSIKPALIHTHSTSYCNLLQRATKQKHDIKQLKLFGNISSKDNSNKTKSGHFNIVLFGNIRNTNRLCLFLEWLKIENHKHHNAITFHFIGKNGKNLEIWKEHLATHNIKYIVHGFLPNDNISKLLYKMDIGIATTPFPMIEKSGTVAAMIEHLLPVICIGDEWKKKYSYTMNTSVIDWTPNLTYDLISSQEITRENTISSVTKQLVVDLSLK